MRKRNQHMSEDEPCTKNIESDGGIVRSFNRMRLQAWKRTHTKQTICVCIVAAVLGAMFVIVMMAGSGHLFAHVSSAAAKRKIEAEFGVNPHYAMHYLTDIVQSHRCVTRHPFSTKRRAAWCVGQHTDVHSATEDDLRWVPPKHIFFQDADMVSLPDDDSSTREDARKMGTYASGFSYCIPPRQERAILRPEEHPGACPQIIRCDFVGSPLHWDDHADDYRFECYQMSTRHADDVGLWTHPGMQSLLANTRILCKTFENDHILYRAPDVHSDYSDCTLSYVRNEKTQAKL